MMLTAILGHFPPHAHPLTVVSDPDGLLADEGALAALAERGFTVVAEDDPVRLRGRVEAQRPFTAGQPLIIITAGRLEDLPYDLWQAGQRVELRLHDFFPDLAYPVVRMLTPAQRWRLAQAPAPGRRLSQAGTVAFVLRHAFDADPAALAAPGRLIAWLDGYHSLAEPLPPLLAEALLARLTELPAYRAWPLAELLTDRAAYADFVAGQWLAYVAGQTGAALADGRAAYLLNFATDESLQDALPRLVRSGSLAPVAVAPEAQRRLPAWARPAVVAGDADRPARRMAELAAALADAALLAQPLAARIAHLADARWDDWSALARAWAELTALRYASSAGAGAALAAARVAAIPELEATLDEAFAAWLGRRYAALGVQRLPAPHHVHHIPHYLAYRRRESRGGRVALLILDGLALADWVSIGATWRGRHPDWRMTERLLLAQIPAITAISRQALVSGLRPAEFGDTLLHNRAEARRWADFWAVQDVPADACPFLRLSATQAGPPDALGDGRLIAPCLVDDALDELAHSTTLGAAGFHAALRLWLDTERGGRRIEAVVGELLGRGFTVYLTSDHGHVEATGIGQPSEGLAVETRGRRARIYADRRAAARVQDAFAATQLWSADGLLPEGFWALMPTGRAAFASAGQVIVTHGGLTLDELVVPFVEIAVSDVQ
jgi:hypothetical protein